MADLVSRAIPYDGTAHTFTVPPHVAGTLTFTLWGAKGGDFPQGGTTSRGGDAGRLSGVLDLTRGTVITVNLGGQGDDGYNSTLGADPTPQGGAGTRPGGDGGIFGSHAFAPPDPGLSYSAGGGGGAASELVVAGSPIAVAGGGGGGGVKTALNASNDGGAGSNGTGDGGDGVLSTASSSTGQGGRGATTSADGAGGAHATNKTSTYVEDGDPGSSGAGGDGGSFIYVPGSTAGGSTCGGGGGGGGGLFGGGGGGGSVLLSVAGTGGGGSSWADTGVVTEGTGPDPLTSDDGFVVFEWEPLPGGIYLDGAIHLS